MLRFPEEYFRQETKMDFNISKMMKCAWAAQLEVLSDVIDVCQKHSIQYYSFWGTLLGAVRHKGFIPWDDDIDICMLREDYMAFLEVVQSELPSSFCVLNVYNEDEYENTFTRITNSHAIDLSEEHLIRYHGCPFVVGIDIFPLDRVPVTAERIDLQSSIASMITQMIGLAKYADKQQDLSVTESVKQSIAEGIAVIEETLGARVNSDRSDLNRLRQLFDHTAMLGNSEKGEYLTSYPEYAQGKGFLLEENWFAKDAAHKMPFENIKINVPSDWDKVLQALYGDYMIPVKGSADHDYPFYKDQLQMLHERGLWMEEIE
ncbi:MAG: LicD family protein [Lachnospiraceae bacterium]|nr:LicD family protein [Lachnospiraceae bacterium]